MISRKRWSNVEKERSLNIKRATYHAMLSRKSRAQISSNNRGYHVGMKSARCYWRIQRMKERFRFWKKTRIYIYKGKNEHRCRANPLRFKVRGRRARARVCTLFTLLLSPVCTCAEPLFLARLERDFRSSESWEWWNSVNRGSTSSVPILDDLDPVRTRRKDQAVA